MSESKARLLSKLLTLLGAPCGAFGGELPRRPGEPPTGRWCMKRFGHCDSCYYDDGPQPLWQLRQRAKGYAVGASM